MQSKKKTRLLLLTVLVVIALAFTVSACSFSFSSGGDDHSAPNTTGYVTMSTKEETPSDASSLTEVIQSLQPKVVEIYATLSDGTGAGSGVVVGKVNDENGKQTGSVIVTNHHVVAGGSKIKVRLYNGEDYDAKLVGSDASGDIAVLEISATGIEPATWIADSDSLKVGQTAVAIGNALGSLGGTVTKGIVSALARSVSVEGNALTLIQTDAAINGGNSGGGLFSETGLLIGIVDAKVQASGVEGLGFAIPANDARNIADRLLNNLDEKGYGFVPGHYYIGVTLAQATNLFGGSYIYVDSLDEYGLGYLAGLNEGDKIISITYNGTTYKTGTEMQALLSSKEYQVNTETPDQLLIEVTPSGSSKSRVITLKITQFYYAPPAA